MGIYAEADREALKLFAQEFLSKMQVKPKSIILLFLRQMSTNGFARKRHGWTFEKRLVVKAP